MTSLYKSLPEGITHSSLLCNVKQGGYQGKPENALKDTSDPDDGIRIQDL